MAQNQTSPRSSEESYRGETPSRGQEERLSVYQSINQAAMQVFRSKLKIIQYDMILLLTYYVMY